jgi:rhodanese-related sulfurtransferase
MKSLHLVLILFGLMTLPALPGRAEDKAASEIPRKRIELKEFEQLMHAKTNVVLDVRTDKEYLAGHIAGAVHLDVNDPKFDETAGKLDKNKTYLVHCASGVRSRRACKRLEELGFKNLYDLAPGFNGWAKAGKPVEKGEPKHEQK